MSKVENKWDSLSEWEKQKAYDDLCNKIRIWKQKKRVNEISIKKRIESIKKDFLGGKI